MTLCSVLLCCGIITSVMGIDFVYIPNSKVEADIRENVVINCIFTKSSVNTHNLRIHWHRVKRNKINVVHSYYNGDDRLNDQDLEYRGRTQLFHHELQQGNASLKLQNIRLSDNGNYRCIVQDKKGTAYDEGMLKVHAKPSFPVITVLQQDGGVMLHCDTNSSNPHPEIIWHYGKTDLITHQRNRTPSVTSEGFFAVRSSLSLESNTQENVCCSVTSAESAQPLQTCTVLRGNSKNLKGLELVYIILSICIIALAIISLLYCWKKQLCSCQLQIWKINAIKKRISKTTGQQITIKVIGLQSHGATSLINSCYYAYKNTKTLKHMAKAGEKTDHHHSSIQTKILLIDGMVMERERPLMEQDDQLWSKDRQLYVHQWKQNMENEMIVFIFVVRCDEAITPEIKSEMSSLFSDIKALTGDYPVAVITKKSLGDPTQAKSVLVDLEIEKIFEVDTYSNNDSQQSKEKDFVFLKIIEACLNIIESRSSPVQTENEAFITV